MNRRLFVRTIACSAPLVRVRGASGKLPNIVYILADDLGWGDLRCYNRDSAIPTPHSDRLASEGMRFTDMHSGSAVCTPTRYGILTGRYAWRTTLKNGVLWGYSPSLIEKGRLTLPGMLRQQGYYTAGVGKWHLGLGGPEKTDYSKPLRPGPLDHGFDYYFGIPASLDMDPYVYIENDRTVEAATSHTPGQNSPRGVFWRQGPIAPGFKIPEVLPTLTAKAESIIQERAKKAEPFFLYFALPAPHTPWVPLSQWQGKSQAGTYGDFVAQVDGVIGRIMQALEGAGVAEETLLVVTSDNGADWKESDKAAFAHRANANWRGEKADIWDGGHRIPFIARWPGQVPAGSLSSQLGCLTDFMATAGAIAGAKLPSDAAEDSFNLLPALRQKANTPIRDSIVHHSMDGMFSIRQGTWKLALGLGSGGFSSPKRIEPKPGGPEGQLYNLAEDPGETNNLWSERQDVVRKLTALLERFQQQGYSRPM
jgi:arylsulfatase A-like enzyme